MGAHVLGGHFLRRLDLETKRVAIKRERRGQVPDGDANVIENGFHDRAARWSRSFAAVYGSSSRRAMRSTIAENSPAVKMSSARCCMKRCDTSSRKRYSLRDRRRAAWAAAVCSRKVQIAWTSSLTPLP